MIIKINNKSKRIVSKRGKIISKSNNSLSEQLDKFLAFGFFLYLSAYLGNKQGTGTIDGIILRVAFVLYVSFFVLKWLLDTKYSKEMYKKMNAENYVSNRFHLGIFVWFLIFTSYGFLSYFWALNGDLVFAQKNSFISILILCLIVPYSIRNKDDLNRYLKLFALSNLYSIIILVIRLPISEWQDEGRLGLTIGWHPNDLGIHLACACLISLYAAKISEKGKKAFYYSIFLVFCTVMFFTGSRQAVIMLVAGILVYNIFMSNNSVVFLRNLLLAGLVVLVLYLLFTKIEVLYDLIGSRFEGLLNYFTGEGEVDGSTLERNYYINQAEYLFSLKPVQGFGMANFAQYMKNIGYPHAVWCHNNYLELLSGLGIIGCALFYVFPVYLTIQVFKLAIRKDGSAIIILTLLVMYFIDDIVAVNYYYIYNNLIYIFAYCVIMINNKKPKIFDN